MSCGTCGIQASTTLQADTGVPAGPPTSGPARCPHCQGFIAPNAPCSNPRCPGPPLLHPRQALDYARAHGPSDATRQAAGLVPEWAYQYALDVDRAPRDDTRAAAGHQPHWAFRYARDVDQAPRADTRQAACGDPHAAYWYAREVDRGPRDDTRAAACQDPHYAWWYARDVDQAPRDDTRQAAGQDPANASGYATWEHALPARQVACQSPYTAYEYARDVDHAPRDDTRTAACQDPYWAYKYATNVDHGPHDATRQAACHDPRYAVLYALEVDATARDDTRAAACQDPCRAYQYASEVDQQQPRDDTRAGACRSAEYAFRYAHRIDRAPHPATREAAAGEPRWAAAYAEWENSLVAGPVRDLLGQPAVAQGLAQSTAQAVLRSPQGQVLVLCRHGTSLSCFTSDTTGQVTAEQWQYGSTTAGEPLAATAFQNTLAARHAQGWQDHCPQCGYLLPAAGSHNCSAPLTGPTPASITP